MERPLKGDVVIMPFPFSDLSGSKLRPALVIAALPGDDVVLCKMTSKERAYPYRIPLEKEDFLEGGLPNQGVIRIDHLFTADRRVIVRSAGRLRQEKMQAITETIVKLLRA